MRVMLIALAAISAAGCASVTRGWEEQVHFNSAPSEALVRTSNGMSCTTPCVLKLARKEEVTAVFSKPGYMTEEVFVKTHLGSAGGAAGLMGNIVLGGVVGAGVDIASGASLDHCPNPVSITLRKAGSTEPPPDPAAPCRVERPAESPPVS